MIREPMGSRGSRLVPWFPRPRDPCSGWLLVVLLVVPVAKRVMAAWAMAQLEGTTDANGCAGGWQLKAGVCDRAGLVGCTRGRVGGRLRGWAFRQIAG